MSSVTVNEFLNVARSLIGLGEDPPGSNHNKITEWYGFDGPWCAMTISYCLHQAGYPDFLYAYVPFVVNDAEMGVNGMQWLSRNADVRSGDLVIFDWNGDGVADHIGVVELANADDSLVTIEGNSGDPGMVRRNVWPDRRFVEGFVRLPLAIAGQAITPAIPAAPPVPQYAHFNRGVSATGLAPVSGGGYAVVASDGAVFTFTGGPEATTPALDPLNKPIVGAAPTPSQKGLYLVAADGGVFTVGDAEFAGSQGASHLNAPVVGIAGHPGRGYWLVGADGGVFGEGVPIMGSLSATQLDGPVVGIAARPQGDGYWLVGADGGVFTFGKARFMGSMSPSHLNKPMVGIAATPTGGGYWLAAGDGGVFSFGDAVYDGSTADRRINAPVVDIISSVSGRGYYLAAADGGVFGFGDAGFKGSVPGLP